MLIVILYTIYKQKVLLKTTPLAPIEVEILLRRGSPQKIGTDSGIKLLKIPIVKSRIQNDSIFE